MLLETRSPKSLDAVKQREGIRTLFLHSLSSQRFSPAHIWPFRMCSGQDAFGSLTSFHTFFGCFCFSAVSVPFLSLQPTSSLWLSAPCPAPLISFTLVSSLRVSYTFSCFPALSCIAVQLLQLLLGEKKAAVTPSASARSCTTSSVPSESWDMSV